MYETVFFTECKLLFLLMSICFLYETKKDFQRDFYINFGFCLQTKKLCGASYPSKSRKYDTSKIIIPKTFACLAVSSICSLRRQFREKTPGQTSTVWDLDQEQHSRNTGREKAIFMSRERERRTLREKPNYTWSNRTPSHKTPAIISATPINRSRGKSKWDWS